MLVTVFGGQVPRLALAADMGMDAAYSGTQAGSPTSVTLTVKSDGTWEVTFGGGDTPAGTPTTGNWAASTLTGIGNDYQVLFTTANSVNSPTITNNASEYTTITGDITITVAKGSANASADVTAAFRSVYGGTGLTETSNFAANGA